MKIITYSSKSWNLNFDGIFYPLWDLQRKTKENRTTT